MTAHLQSQAAIFINFDHIYKHLEKQTLDDDYTSSLIQLVHGLRAQLGQACTPAALSYAYADFEHVATGAMQQLYLMGITTKHLPHTVSKTTPANQLGLDVLDLLYTRPDITTFVFVGAERDYMVLVHHLRLQCRQVLLAGFRPHTSGDLLASLGNECFLDAKRLLAGEPAPALPEPEPLVAAVTSAPAEKREHVAHISLPEPDAEPELAARPFTDPRPYPAMLRDFERSLEPLRARDPRQDETDVLLYLINELSLLRARPGIKTGELWMTPIMKKLSNKYPSLGHIALNDIIKDLEAKGVITIEKRPGTPHDFSVILLHEEHAEVLAIYQRQAAA